MGREIERKFLVSADGWKRGAVPTAMRQGYIALGPPASVRVRIEGTRAFLNVKESTLGIGRGEFEYEIPVEDAEALLGGLTVGDTVEKTRYRVAHEGVVWEVDVFEGRNAGLVLAEVELEEEEQATALPDWAGEEVSEDPRYRNTFLSQHPYSTWQEDKKR